MPRAAPHPCHHPGCRALTSSRFCAAHVRSVHREIDRHRGNAAARGYDRAWQQMRKSFLADHPLCECDDCQAGKKRVTAATIADHVKSIADYPELRLDRANLRAMSKPCHDRRTARDQAFGRTRGAAPKGRS